MKATIVIIICLVILSCKNDRPKIANGVESEVIQSFPNTKEPIVHTLYMKYIKENDVHGYNNLSADIMLVRNSEILLYYSMKMANKNSCPSAYFNTYYALRGARDGSSYGDEKTRNLAMYYLVKSYELGYDRAKYDMANIFVGNNKVQKSGYYLTQYYK